VRRIIGARSLISYEGLHVMYDKVHGIVGELNGPVDLLLRHQ